MPQSRPQTCAWPWPSWGGRRLPVWRAWKSRTQRCAASGWRTSPAWRQRSAARSWPPPRRSRDCKRTAASRSKSPQRHWRRCQCNTAEKLRRRRQHRFTVIRASRRAMNCSWPAGALSCGSSWRPLLLTENSSKSCARLDFFAWRWRPRICRQSGSSKCRRRTRFRHHSARRNPPRRKTQRHFRPCHPFPPSCRVPRPALFPLAQRMPPVLRQPRGSTGQALKSWLGRPRRCHR
mmetsp:Transcript_4435/g.10630  ORF Transcript_4435/g.10630 Transcript_4435/m.10630 type:complete len:234 (+) Transcript_4435:2003-2704(+)